MLGRYLANPIPDCVKIRIRKSLFPFFRISLKMRGDEALGLWGFSGFKVGNREGVHRTYGLRVLGPETILLPLHHFFP